MTCAMRVMHAMREHHARHLAVQRLSRIPAGIVGRLGRPERIQ
jgi:hypothetical protein